MAQQESADEILPARKRTFWVPDELYERVRKRVGSTKQSEGMSINRFVRDALESALKKPR